MNFEEAVKYPKWRFAMDEEIKSIEKKIKHETWWFYPLEQRK